MRITGTKGSCDYGVITADGKPGESVMSWRYYLQDASFLVGLSGEDVSLLKLLHEALREPVWPLNLGRKSYVPSTPVYLKDGLWDGDLLTVLQRYPLPAGLEPRVRAILDDPAGTGGEVRTDYPLDFARRRFGVRPVRVEFLTVTT